MARRDVWYKNAIIYCLDVETYADSDGDGVGDFAGLTSRLDYLAGLGVNTLWLMPFYPTPGLDDGYDITDYTTVDPRYGTMADFVEFMVEARELGMRVITDLVPNHTSDQHPWFQAAREDPTSKYRDYYVWRQDEPPDTSDQVVFPGVQESIWTYDEKVKAWYLHHFHAFQPDLNYANPEVQREFERIMGLWLELGVAGFRVDAAPFLISLTGVDTGVFDMEMAHQYLERMQDFVVRRRGNAILLGEVDVGLSTIADYFGGGNQLHALFNFPMNRYVFLGLAQQSADPVSFGLNQLPTVPDDGQWVNFLRHHDELNLARITEKQRQTIYEAFGDEPKYQVFDRGLRRRLAPMLDGDIDRIKLAFSLLFSLPGAPMIFYGEEIGMGENLELERRMAVRAPMQWTSCEGGGFSSAPMDEYVRPILVEGPYGYEETNVASQRGNSESLLNWIASLIRTRKESSEIGHGAWTVIDTGSDAIFGIRYDDQESSIVVFNNLSGERQTATLDLEPQELVNATDLLGDQVHKPLTDTAGRMRLDAYGWRWLRLGGVY